MTSDTAARLAREFLQAMSGAERLAWPPAWGVVLEAERISRQDKKRSGAAALRKLTEGASPRASGVCGANA